MATWAGSANDLKFPQVVILPGNHGLTAIWAESIHATVNIAWIDIAQSEVPANLFSQF